MIGIYMYDSAIVGWVICGWLPLMALPPRADNVRFINNTHTHISTSSRADRHIETAVERDYTDTRNATQQEGLLFGHYCRRRAAHVWCRI